MSYARFSEGDVYLYASVGGGIFCDSCRLRVSSAPAAPFTTYDEAIAHVREHMKHGHRVPDRTIPALEADRDAGESLEWEPL